MSVINSIKDWFDRIYFAWYKTKNDSEYSISERHIEHKFSDAEDFDNSDRETTYFFNSYEHL